MTLQARVVNSQFGLKLECTRVTFKDIKTARNEVMTSDPNVHDESARGVNRDLKKSRKDRLITDFKNALSSSSIGTELITDNFHLVLCIDKSLKEGALVNPIQLIKTGKLTIVDGNGRFVALLELSEENPEWLQTPVYIQLYLNPTREEQIFLMEVLNARRSTLEKNFATHLEAEFYDSCTDDSKIEERHIVAKVAKMIAFERKSPLRNRVKFHDTKNKGISLNSVATSIASSTKITDVDETFKAYLTGLKALSAATGDQIFGDHWGTWLQGAGTMLNILMSGMMYAYYLENGASELKLASKYASIFNSFLSRNEIRVNRFTKLGGQRNHTLLLNDLKAAIQQKVAL